MLNVQKMIKDAEACLGWPYQSPGSNDQNGIDCSGLFVRIFRDQGASIYHGSNTIWREYCTEKGEIKSQSQLIPGMAVFKWNAATPEKFHDGQGDFHHIGLVISGNPLKIIHASSAAGRVIIDEKIGQWKYWAKLKNVDYGGEAPVDTAPDAPKPTTQFAVVTADSKTVKMRFRPSKSCNLYDEVKVGTIVTVNEWGKEWSKISYGNRIEWYMMTEFLKTGDEEEKEPDKTEEPVIPETVPQTSNIQKAIIASPNGKPVKMRKNPSTACRLYDDLPNGTEVEVVKFTTPWAQISYGSRKGWFMQTKFLKSKEREGNE